MRPPPLSWGPFQPLAEMDGRDGPYVSPPEISGYPEMELERRTVTEYEYFDSPDSLLASFFSKPEKSPTLLLVTGESGAGKTTWCRTLIERARTMGIHPCGLISPAIFEAGEKAAINLIDISSNSHKRMAIRQSSPVRGFQSKGSLNWLFSNQALKWGNEILQKLTSSDLLIVDEFGPLELLENDGLTNGLKLIDEQRYRLACVVVRPSLLATALERWPWGVVLDVSTKVLGIMRVTS